MSDRRPMIRLGQFLFLFNVLLSIFYLSTSANQAQEKPPANVAEQVYVNPTMWPGVLVLQSGLLSGDAATAEADLKSLAGLLSAKSGRVLLVVEPATIAALELKNALEDRTAQVTKCDAADFGSKLNDNDVLENWANCKSIWIDSTPTLSAAISKLDSASHLRLEKCLDQVLANGGFIRLTGDLSWLGTDGVNKRTTLLANCKIDTTNSDVTKDKSLVHIYMPEGSRCVIGKRQLINITKENPIKVRLEPTEQYAEPLEKVLKEGESIDWVQWQRALMERQSPVFPGRDRVGHSLAGGSLVIGGGGGMPEEVWERFVELAGGEHARIVILPTAVENPNTEPAFEARVLKLAGAEHIVTLPQIERNEVEAANFLAELDQATGVWFGGGRQWRFVDAYWGTPAWKKLQDVCRRGGVIGGSSAGATIQGDLLVRGAPAGNQIMIADGYRRGLGLLPGVAIDQHFSQRNRFRELEGCLADFPSICGIGIDEQTALVVTSPDKCSVIGSGSVWLYPSYDANDDHRPDGQTRSAMRKEHKSGSEFSLAPK